MTNRLLYVSLCLLLTWHTMCAVIGKSNADRVNAPQSSYGLKLDAAEQISVPSTSSSGLVRSDEPFDAQVYRDAFPPGENLLRTVESTELEDRSAKKLNKRHNVGRSADIKIFFRCLQLGHVFARIRWRVEYDQDNPNELVYIPIENISFFSNKFQHGDTPIEFRAVYNYEFCRHSDWPRMRCFYHLRGGFEGGIYRHIETAEMDVVTNSHIPNGPSVTESCVIAPTGPLNRCDAGPGTPCHIDYMEVPTHT